MKQTILAASAAVLGSLTAASAATVTLSITTDSFPEETSWQFETDPGGVLVASGPTTPYSGNTTVTETFDFEPDDYTFTMFDSFGDGLCCTFGDGTWSLSFQGTTIVSPTGGEFGSSEAVDFTVAEDSTVIPLPAGLPLLLTGLGGLVLLARRRHGG